MKRNARWSGALSSDEGAERLAWLRALPVECWAGGLTVVHAQPDDLWRAPRPDANDGELLAAYRRLGADQVA